MDYIVISARSVVCYPYLVYSNEGVCVSTVFSLLMYHLGFSFQMDGFLFSDYGL